jgi:multisubunit Na+/H+ antiporter MnhE subunit
VEALRACRFWVIAFVFSYAVWMVHDDSAKLPELLAGAAVAALSATGTELARRQRVAGIAVRPRMLRHAARVVPAAVRDCGALTVMAFRQLIRPQAVRGRTVALPFVHGGDAPAANGRHALAQALGSFAPRTIVVGIDPDRDMLIAHQLGVGDDPHDLDPLELG